MDLTISGFTFPDSARDVRESNPRAHGMKKPHFVNTLSFVKDFIFSSTRELRFAANPSRPYLSALEIKGDESVMYWPVVGERNFSRSGRLHEPLKSRIQSNLKHDEHNTIIIQTQSLYMR